MAFFADQAEVDSYIGRLFREAGEHPEIGAKLTAADLVMRVEYSDPDCVMTAVLRDPIVTMWGEDAPAADVTLMMSADTADRFWRGDYNLAVGLAKGQVRAKGPVNKILKLVPLTKPMFPVYRELVAPKDAAAGA